MASHDDRMRRLGRYQLPTDPILLGRLKRSSEMNIPLRLAVKDRWEVTYSRFFAQLNNGSGLLMDQELREFSTEVNGRVWKCGLRDSIMPSSFNIVEAFLNYNPGHTLFTINPELDHIFNIEAFMDYATGHTEINLRHLLAAAIPEGFILSYNICNSLDSMMFSINESTNFAVGGVSLIRHGREISMIMSIGEHTDLDKRSDEILNRRKNSPFLPAPGKEMLTPSEEHQPGAVPLLGDKRFARGLALARFDIQSLTYESRYLLSDEGDMYTVLSDDKQYFVASQLGAEPADTMAKGLIEHEAIFNICKIMTQLPLYFQDNLKSISFERRPTELSIQSNKTKYRKAIKHCSAQEKILSREIKVLDLPPDVRADRAVYGSPDFQLETKGWWRTIGYDEIGMDKDGKPIHGRTWVEEKFIRARPDRSKYVVTSPRLGQTDGEEENPNSGYIYVMRCIAHEKNVFKIGMTKRTSYLRASELTAATAAPDEFHVVYEWKVTNCIAAEKEVHAILDKYRLNDKREFFQAPLTLITNAIEQVGQKYKT